MIKVDKDKCIGCGLCAGTASDSFIIGSDGKAQPISDQATDEAKEAANNCPVEAISVE